MGQSVTLPPTHDDNGDAVIMIVPDDGAGDKEVVKLIPA